MSLIGKGLFKSSNSSFQNQLLLLELSSIGSKAASPASLPRGVPVAPVHLPQRHVHHKVLALRRSAGVQRPLGRGGMPGPGGQGNEQFKEQIRQGS